MMRDAAGLVLVLGVSWLGCGGGSEADGDFSQRYAAEIHKDCTESVNCALQRDEQVEDDPFNECFKDSSAALDADAERQSDFLTNYGRCSQFVVCDYYDCAISGASGYGQSQAPRVQQKCQAESDCRAASGMPDADAAYAVNSCLAFGIGELDPLTAPQRMAWETAFLRCSMLGGCDFVGCFQP